MISDEERREVAQNMRDGVKSKTEFELLSLNGSSAAIRWLISYVVFGDKKYHSGADLMNRLADLIDPDCEEGRYSVARTVRPIDREALLELAEEIETNDVCYVVSEQYVCDEYARRIREALGVTDG